MRNNPNPQSTKERLSANAFAKAAELGSNARTIRGVLRYLRAQRVSPIQGLAALSNGGGALPSSRRSRLQLKELPTSHEQRVKRRAALAAQTAFAATKPYDALQLLAATWVPDARQAADWPYRRSESTWAGGGHYVSVSVGEAPQPGADRSGCGRATASGAAQIARLI